MVTHRHLRCLAIAAGLGLAAIGPAQAQDAVYKCADGSYTATPCAGGVKLDAADPRAAAQRRQAQEAAQREAKLADKLAAQRHAEEQGATPMRAGNLAPHAAAPHAAASAPAKHPKKRHKGKAALVDDANLSPPMRGADAPVKKKH